MSIAMPLLGIQEIQDMVMTNSEAAAILVARGQLPGSILIVSR